MKVKFVRFGKNEKFVHNGKPVKAGDILDVPKERAEELKRRGLVEYVDENKGAKGVK